MKPSSNTSKGKRAAKRRRAIRRKRILSGLLNALLAAVILSVVILGGGLLLSSRDDGGVRAPSGRVPSPEAEPSSAPFTAGTSAPMETPETSNAATDLPGSVPSGAPFTAGTPAPMETPETSNAATDLPGSVPSGAPFTANTSAPIETPAPSDAELLLPPVVPTVSPTPAPRSAHFRVTGDLMASESVLKYAQSAAGGDGYDFSPMFTLVQASLQSADYTMGNLETTIGRYKDLAYSGYPMFNTPESYLDALQGAGYDFLTLANNHMLDRYFDGMKTTVDNVEAKGFDYCGAYRTQAERDAAKVIEIGGIRFGFLSYTQGTNGVETYSNADAKQFGVPYLFESDFAADIAKLRQAGAEVVIVFPHWGEEYNRQPDATELRYARKLAEAGADIILASHPHVVQKTETLAVADGERTRGVFVAYSLGNFVATQEKPYTDTGIILDFTVQEQPDGTFKVIDPGYIPTYCWRHDGTLTVVPSSQYLDQRPEGMSDSTYRRMRASYDETLQLFGDTLPVLTK